MPNPAPAPTPARPHRDDAEASRNPVRPSASAAGATGKAEGPGASAGDWQAAGLVDQMLAYRDWWNLPVRPLRGRDSQGPNRTTGDGRATADARKTGIPGHGFGKTDRSLR